MSFAIFFVLFNPHENFKKLWIHEICGIYSSEKFSFVFKNINLLLMKLAKFNPRGNLILAEIYNSHPCKNKYQEN